MIGSLFDDDDDDDDQTAAKIAPSPSIWIAKQQKQDNLFYQKNENSHHQRKDS